MSLPTLEIMDIGAMSEKQDRYVTLVDQGLAHVTGFEPNPESLSKLRSRKGPNRYLSNFLGDGKTRKFHITRYPGCSSLLEPNGDVINLFATISTTVPTGNFSIIETAEVETTRLDDIDVPVCDYLKIDVQGAELLVMENASKALAGALVLETEVEFIPIYKDQPLFGDIQSFLVKRGFMLHKLIDIAGRTLRPLALPNRFMAMSQALWADAIFIRDYFVLASYSNEQLLKAALVLNDVYLSYDVVVRLLGEYDRRTGSTLVEKYKNALAAQDEVRFLFMNLNVDP
jgi:FkbM family methyltransferase